MKQRISVMVVMIAVLAIASAGTAMADERLVEGRVVAIEGNRIVLELDDGTYEAFLLPEGHAYPTLAVNHRVELVVGPKPIAGTTFERTVVEQGEPGEVIFEDETVVVGEAPPTTVNGEVVINTGDSIWVSSVMGLEQFTFEDGEDSNDDLYEGRRVVITYVPLEEQRSRVITRIAQAETTGQEQLETAAYCRNLRVIDGQDTDADTRVAQVDEGSTTQERDVAVTQERTTMETTQRTMLPQTGTSLPALLLGGLTALLLGGVLAVARRF